MIREIKRLGSIRQYRVGKAGIAHVQVAGCKGLILLIKLPPDEQGEGAGTQSYRDIGATLKAQGVTLTSSDCLSDATRAIWQRLAEEGLARAIDAGWEWV